MCGFLRPPPHRIQSFGLRHLPRSRRESPEPRRRPACARHRRVRARSLRRAKSPDGRAISAQRGEERIGEIASNNRRTMPPSLAIGRSRQTARRPHAAPTCRSAHCQDRSNATGGPCSGNIQVTFENATDIDEADGADRKLGRQRMRERRVIGGHQRRPLPAMRMSLARMS
jgi:hypothetical protein